MFERFTERARKVVVLAQDEARHFGHDYIGTEHLLLGLIREKEGIASRVLRDAGARLDEAREQLEVIVGYGEGTGAQAPFTPRTQEVLRLAVEVASDLGDDHVGTEHILLGLVREGEGVADRMLANLGVDPEEVDREVLKLATGEREERSEPYLGDGPFCTRIPGIGLRVRHGKDARERAESRTVRVDIEVLHEAPLIAGTDELIAGLKPALEQTGFTLPESLVDGIGGYVMRSLPEAGRATVVATPDPADGETPRVSVSRTFERR